MFKIVENGDGSTSVFCKASGRLICQVKGRKPSAVAVGRPLLREATKTNEKRAIKRYSPSLPKGDSPLEKKQRIESWADCAGNSDKNSFVSTSDSVSSKDLSDDCVDQFSFLQVFDLVGTSELQLKGANELRRTFPRCTISRVRPLMPTASALSSRPFDDMELCSPLGMRLCPIRHQLGPAAQEQAVKKYDKYCKISVLSLHPNQTLHPALRNRESMKYGVTFRPPKGSRGTAATHLYSFSARQRHERFLQLVTGLDRRSRTLKEYCKTVSVHLKRLTPQEIADHTRRESLCKSVVQCESDDDDCVVIGEVIRTKRPRGCTVPLEDVSQQLVQVGGEYHLRGTPLRVHPQDPINGASRQGDTKRSSLMARAYQMLDAMTQRLNSIVSIVRE